jgi:ATP-binding cassette subfamily F protein uup
MPLISLRDVSVRFRGPPLLDGVSCYIEAGQRIGLLGRNGAGKTTLMRLVSGQIQPDAGEVIAAPGTTVALLRQDVPQDMAGPIRDVVAAGLPPEAGANAGDGEEHDTAWQREHAVDQILSRMSLVGEVLFETLSSGMKRRVLLARALVAAPDLLLLDEPTNHLDIDAIEWLETFLERWGGTLVFVTHDRAFLRRMARRILEIDRGRIFDWSCNYDTFLGRKEAAIAAEEKQSALFDKKLAQEEAWIRTGIKARRTRNEGRVRALESMRRDHALRRNQVGRTSLRIQEAQRSGALVAAVEDVSFGHGERPILQRFSATVMRGDRIGIVGPNGAGKTTLLRLLLGSLEPESGTVRLGTNLQVAFFDQLRDQLDDEKSVADNVSDGYETVSIDGKPRHVLGYLQDFLFEPERARMPVKFLSGGERNRVLLARHFAKPANVIVLDEPTNDLDAETLELLEERLAEFAGTVLVVSHDRAFLDNVVTSLLVFEPLATTGSGGDARPTHGVKEYVGGYSDWLRQRQVVATEPKAAAASRRTAEPERTEPGAVPAASKRKKLSFREQQELAALPAVIESLETMIAAMHVTMTAADYYRQPGDVLALEKSRLDEAERRLAEAFIRWESLDAGSSTSHRYGT